MNFDDRVRAADSTLDDRLRAAGSALREGSITQIDAAGRLREILRHADEASPEPVIQLGPSPVRSVASLRRRTQRRALAVNLLLSLVLGVVLGIVFQRSQVPDPPVPPERTVAAVTPTTTTTEAQDRHLGPGGMPGHGRAGRPGYLQAQSQRPRRAALPGAARLHHCQPGLPEGLLALAVRGR